MTDTVANYPRKPYLGFDVSSELPKLVQSPAFITMEKFGATSLKKQSTGGTEQMHITNKKMSTDVSKVFDKKFDALFNNSASDFPLRFEKKHEEVLKAVSSYQLSCCAEDYHSPPTITQFCLAQCYVVAKESLFVGGLTQVVLFSRNVQPCVA